MITSETPPALNRELRCRYTVADVSVFTQEETKRFVPTGSGDPSTDIDLAWQLLYRLEPGLYDRLVSAERIHRGVLDWLPKDVEQIVEVAAGTGRLTLELLHSPRDVLAIEPAAPLREILNQKLKRADHGDCAKVIHGFFDDLPVVDASADLVIACSALTPAPQHGGDAGLAEMERVCNAGGLVVVVWPNNVPWLTSHGYEYVSFDGTMFVEFASSEEAAEMSEIFYPCASREVRRLGSQIPYEVLGINPPCDLAYKVVER